MHVIGIDPGIERTGFAILETRTNNGFALLECGRILTDKKMPLAARLNIVADDLRAILKQWKPQTAALEQVFFSRNVKTAITVSHARGVILELLEEHGIAVREFNPGEIKLAVTGDGRADKLQMRKMINMLLKQDIRHDDTVDAVAAGICLLQTLCVTSPLSHS